MSSNPADIVIDRTTTALVLIDLQRGIVSGETLPHRSVDVVSRAAAIATACRKAGVLVVLVRVDPGPDGRLMPRPMADMPRPQLQITPEWTELVPELGHAETDVFVTKHQHNAFYATDLDVQLRRRGIRTILMGGISTNVGVEATARAAFELGYEQILVEDAMAARDGQLHEMSTRKFLPTIARVRSTAQVLAALA